MANLIASVGYSLGKLHTGMIAYLCDLHREGVVAPLEAFFGALGLTAPRCPVPRREWNSVDLAIFDDDSKDPDILIEMKVDDHDHMTTRRPDGRKKTDYQTVLYPELYPDCRQYLYVTLGMGEYYHAPYGERFRWVRVREFLAALDRIETTDKAVLDWRESIRNEVDLQDRVNRSDPSRFQEYRAGAWNIYFLGQMKEYFERRLGPDQKGIDPVCFPYGRRPDTILYFGNSKSQKWAHAYMEINHNGRLNVKVNCEEAPNPEEAISNLARRMRSDFPEDAREPDGKSNKDSQSRTAVNFDIGLKIIGGRLAFEKGREYTLERLKKFVEPFCAVPRGG